MRDGPVDLSDARLRDPFGRPLFQEQVREPISRHH